MTQKIKALDPQVVHKIAAGEIIVSPTNALKELLENSIDAGATSVEVVVKQGGHKLLQVTDNGNGIDEDDLEILCQRFTTSKISNFHDLESVSTLGFRGEALASISHIAHLSVRTKTKDARTASLVTYHDGKLTSKKKTAGVQGTQIIVEDMFYNSPLRTKVFRSESSNSAEYQKILDIVSKYSIHYPGTFSCKRHQDSQPVVISGNTRLEKLRKVYGNSTAEALIELKMDGDDSLGLKGVEGYVSGLNYQSKRSIPFIFFINKRLVSCDPLSRAIRKVYQDFLPRGNTSAFVYLSIEIDPRNIDVNVHPTKREIFFLHENELIEAICEKIRMSLQHTEHERDYRVQSYIATSVPVTRDEHREVEENDDVSVSNTSKLVVQTTKSKAKTVPNINSFSIPSLSKPRYEYNLVRTDPQQGKITSFIKSKGSPCKVRKDEREPLSSDGGAYDKTNESSSSDDDLTDNSELGDKGRGVNTKDKKRRTDTSKLSENHTSRSKHSNKANALESEMNVTETNTIEGINSASVPPRPVETSSVENSTARENVESEPKSPVKIMAEKKTKMEFKPLQLSSVNELLMDVKAHAQLNLLYAFSENTFVGVVDKTRGLAAIQVSIRLYIVEYMSVFKELFYQTSLLQLGNFGTIHLGDGLSVTQLLALAPQTDGNAVSFQSIIDMREMLKEYFQISFRERNNEWTLVQLPILIPGYKFPISRIPQFIFDLATTVDWSNEKNCLQGVSQCLSTLHLPVVTSRTDSIRLLFDASKTSFVPSRALLPCVIEIANLPGLYKVFERC